MSERKADEDVNVSKQHPLCVEAHDCKDIVLLGTDSPAMPNFRFNCEAR